ncbi:MAG TPA: MBL fold metallo-hydrolase, partial [Ramlibacter sp.]
MALRSFWKAAAAACAALALAAAQAQPAATRKVEPQQVSPSAWLVQGDTALGTPANRNFISHAGFV